MLSLLAKDPDLHRFANFTILPKPETRDPQLNNFYHGDLIRPPELVSFARTEALALAATEALALAGARLPGPRASHEPLAPLFSLPGWIGQTK